MSSPAALAPGSAPGRRSLCRATAVSLHKQAFFQCYFPRRPKVQRRTELRTPQGARRVGWHSLGPLPLAPGPPKAPDSSRVHAPLQERKTPPFCKASSTAGASLRCCRVDSSRCATRSPRRQAAKPLPAASHTQAPRQRKKLLRQQKKLLEGLRGEAVTLPAVGSSSDLFKVALLSLKKKKNYTETRNVNHCSSCF